MNITAVGIDLAKNVLQVHGVDARGKVVLRRQLRRDQVVLFFANLPAWPRGWLSALRGSLNRSEADSQRPEQLTRQKLAPRALM